MVTRVYHSEPGHLYQPLPRLFGRYTSWMYHSQRICRSSMDALEYGRSMSGLQRVRRLDHNEEYVVFHSRLWAVFRCTADLGGLRQLFAKPGPVALGTEYRHER